MHCGKAMASVFKHQGAVGLVSDCTVHDIPQGRALRFHFFAAGAAASHADFRTIGIGIPIQLEGMVVCPGDLLNGDRNGLATLPTTRLEELPELVEAVRTTEREEMEFVRSPEFTLERLKV